MQGNKKAAFDVIIFLIVFKRGLILTMNDPAEKSFRVIVLGSNPATRLSLIRCVGAVKGCRVTVVNMVSRIPEKPSRTLDTYSKYVDHWLFSKKFDADGLAKVLLEQCRIEGEKPLLMSVDDDSACLVDTIQDQIRDFFCFSHINNKSGAIATLMDKAQQKKLAKEFGFNVVESWPMDCVDGKYFVPEGIKYPCYVKGRLSYHSAKQYQRKCNSKEELEQWLLVIAKHNPSPLLAEEYIKIDKEYGIIGFSDTDKVVLPGVVDLLDGGHGGHKGVSAFGRVNDFSHDFLLKQQIERFIKNIRLTGLFNLDIVEAYGKLYFVELNLRFAAYGYAVFKAGVNLPAYQVFHSQEKTYATLKSEVVSGYSYANERVAFDDVAGGYRTWRNYKELLQKADCRLVYCEDDPNPYRVFRRQMRKTFLLVRLKKALRKK